MSGPRRIDLRSVPPGEVDPGPIVAHLREGGLLGHPTETVYGLGGTLAPDAVEALRGLKGRDEGKPFLVLLPGPDAASRLAWTPAARELAEVFWPGALTLVLADPDGAYPDGVRSPEGSVAVRWSPHPLVRRIVEALGEPLTSTSANAPGSPPALDGTGALDAARALGAGPELWVLDAGALPPSAPSTIVDCSGSAPRVVRAGATPPERLRCVRPEIAP